MSCGCKKKRNCGSTTACATIDDMESRLAGVQATPLATTTQYGKSKLSWPAALKSAPIIVANNDPIIRATRKTIHMETYGHTPAGYALAAAAINTDEAILRFTSQCSFTADLTIPDNIYVEFDGAGSIAVATTKTVTVKKMIDPGHRKVFYAAGTGKVVLDKGAVLRNNLAWWAGPTPPANADSAIKQAFASLTAQEGGFLDVGVGTWIATGNYTQPDNSIIYGAGKDSNGAGGTCFQLPTGSSGTCFFKHVVGQRNTFVFDCAIDALENAVNPNCVPVEFYGQGTYGVDLYSLIGATYQNVLFFRGKWGRWIHDNALGGWELQQMRFIDCQSIGQSSAAVRTECVNGGYVFDHEIINNRASVDSFDFYHIGVHTIINPLHGGESGALACSSGQPNVLQGGTCYKYTLSHQGGTIIGHADEAMQFGAQLKSGFPSTIAFIGCRFASLIESTSNEVNFINIIDGSYYANSIRSSAGSSLTVGTAGAIEIASTDLCGNSVPERTLADFEGTGSVITSLNNAWKRRQRFGVPVQAHLEKTWDGNDVVAGSFTYSTGNSETKDLVFVGRTDEDGISNPLGMYTGRQHEANAVIADVAGRMYTRFNQDFGPRTKGRNYNGDLVALNFTGATKRIAITADQNNYELGDYSAYKHLVVTSSGGNWKFTGLAATYIDWALDGMEHTVTNGNAAGGLPIGIAHQNASSDAVNRFFNATADTIWLYPGERAVIRYNSSVAPTFPAGTNDTAGRWYVSADVPRERVLSAVLSSAVTRSNTSTLANTGLSVTVIAGAKYDIWADFLVQQAGKACKVAFGGTSTDTDFRGSWKVSVIDTAVIASPPYAMMPGARTTAFSPTALDGTGYLQYKFRGHVEINAGGTFLLQDAQTAAQVSNTSIFTGGRIKLTQINNV